MTIIRQWAITNSTRGDMRKLMNEDERILIRDEQFLPSINGGSASWRKWDSLMEGTRRMFGHDKPSRHVRDKKTGELVQAKNTIMYHQILAFLPDECDINGGKQSSTRSSNTVMCLTASRTMSSISSSTAAICRTASA